MSLARKIPVKATPRRRVRGLGAKKLTTRAAKLRTAAPPDPTTVPVWEFVVALGRTVPPAEWAKVPTDGARNLDHYLYRAPKVEA